MRSLAGKLIVGLRVFLTREVNNQSDRWPLWSAVFFGAGCGSYFLFRVEPPFWPLILAAVVLGVGWIVARQSGVARPVSLLLLMAAMGASGLAIAKARSDAVAAPIAPSMRAPTVIEAWVIDVDSPGRTGPRVVVAPVSIKGLAAEQTPHRMRVTLKGEIPKPGQAVQVFGIVNPPPAPASPESYDFGRNAWFEGIGGLVFSLSDYRGATLQPPPLSVRWEMKVNAVRYALAERIIERLGVRRGGIAAAMTTGHETWIQEDDLQAMRDSGLAHILSISGLHMAVVGGFVFFAVRLAVALAPSVVLRVSGKKVAACAGLMAVGGYLVLSGAPPPAERAAITASIAFLAVLFGRQAISMRALATAAILVLALRPESIVTPGFQMSFAATAALVALAEIWPRRVKEINTPWPISGAQRGMSWLAGAAGASLVAGMATGPFAMQHFNRTAVFGLIANLASAPMADIVMMPALALGAMLEPMGLGAPFLWLAGWCVEFMLAIGHWTAGLPGAVQEIASAPAIALPVAFVGIMMMCLWRGWLRFLGLPLAMAVLIWPRAAPPDVWIADQATNAAWVVAGEAEIMRPVRQFGTNMWSQRWNLKTTLRDRSQWRCGRVYCRSLEEEKPVALWWGRAVPSEAQLLEMCGAAEVVAIRSMVTTLPAECANRLVLDGKDFAARGAVELWRTEGGWRAVWARDRRGDRPWGQWGDVDYQ